MQKSVNEDYSLAELAESEGISRQGARDALRRGFNELRRLESALRLVERLQAQEALLLRAERLLCDKTDEADELRGIIKTVNTLWENNIGI